MASQKGWADFERKKKEDIYPYKDTCLIGWIPQELADVDIVWIMSHIIHTVGKRDVYEKEKKYKET